MYTIPVMVTQTKLLAALRGHAFSLAFTSALLLRLVFIFQWRQTPYYGNLLVDALVHQQWALEILGGKLLRGQAFYQSPFYPYLLAIIYKISGVHLLVPLLLQALASSATCVLSGKIAERCFDRRTGIVTAFLCAFYAPFIFYSALLLKETFAIFALALFCLLALRSLENGGAKNAFLCGLAGGWTVLSRGNALFLLPVLPVCWLYFGKRLQKPWRLAGVFVIGVLLPVLPVTLHNYAASRDFVPINYTDGFIFYAGNNAQAIGAMDYPAGISSSPREEERQTTEIASRALGHPAKPSEVSSYWKRRAFSEIAANPGAWLALTARKIYFFINRFEPPDQYHLPFIRENFSTLLALPLLNFGLLCSLGVIGIALLGGSNYKAVVLAVFGGIYSLSVVAVTVSERYRLPVLIFLLPFAAATLCGIFDGALLRCLRQKPWKLLAALPFLLICMLPPLLSERALDAQCWGKLLFMYNKQGDTDRALACLDKAFAASPGNVSREAILMGALIYEQRGDQAAAQALYAKAGQLPR